MCVLVLGGAGYIGSHTVVELIHGGESVVVVDNLQTGHRAAVHPAARLYVGDIRDREFLDRVFREQDVEAVIHFAANSQVGESVAKPLAYYQNNVYGTMVLLEAMVAHGVGALVFSSTAATYGDPAVTPLDEEQPTRPTNPYGQTKLAVEEMCRWVANAGGPRTVCLRYFNAAGAHRDARLGEDHRPETHLVPLVLQVAAGERPYIGIYGDDYPTADGTCLRDYIHVTDLAHAHLAALRHLRRGGAGEICNLGTGTGSTVREVVAAARRVTGRPIPEQILPRRPGDPAQLVASNAKAERLLGFRPAHSDLETIIATAWQWHRNHPKGFDGAA
ncbi:MAG: UDP-glucose 4-epimerase GalE [Planctomycetes bacterium]|nr:UDP-glucose 4-epimerase GalE [Planctomycetota bacterium]